MSFRAERVEKGEEERYYVGSHEYYNVIQNNNN